MGNLRRPLASIAAVVLGGIVSLNANAAESPYGRLESLDKRFDALIAPNTKIDKIADDLQWSEGPLWDARTKSLLFSDIPQQRDHEVARREGRLALPGAKRLHRCRPLHRT